MEDLTPRGSPQKGDRRPYETPSMTHYGEVSKITAGMDTGQALDETFPTGTPFEDLTFS